MTVICQKAVHFSTRVTICCTGTIHRALAFVPVLSFCLVRICPERWKKQWDTTKRCHLTEEIEIIFTKASIVLRSKRLISIQQYSLLILYPVMQFHILLSFSKKRKTSTGPRKTIAHWKRRQLFPSKRSTLKMEGAGKS